MKKDKWLVYAEFLQAKKVLLLVVIVLLALLSALSVRSIELKTRIQDLLPENNPVVESYNNINDEFNTSSILLTIEKGSRIVMERAADELVEKLKNDERLADDFRAVRTRMDRDFIIDKGLLIADYDDLEDYRSMTANPGLLSFVTALNDNLEAAWLDGDGEDVSSPSDEQELLESFNQMENFARGMREWIEGDSSESLRAAENLIDTLFVGDPYFYSPDYEMLIIQISPDFSISDRKRLSRVIAGVNEIIRIMEDKYPELQFGVSGDIAQEADEEAALGFDALYPALAALLVILILFYFSLPSLRSIFFALIALALGILFDLGLIGISLKELNMITSSFGALLVGLGIDFGIHIITRYGDTLEKGKPPVRAMADTLKSTVPPVTIGGVTTALAFFALCLSKTKGFVQFGFVAGFGIILVLLSMFTVLPLLLLSFEKSSLQRRSLRLSYSSLSRWGCLLSKKRGLLILISALMMVIPAAFLIPSLSYDYDMRRIGPQNTPSKATENRIIEAYELSPFPSFLSVDDLEEARELTESLRSERIVSNVSSPSDFIGNPVDQAENLKFLKDWHNELNFTESGLLGSHEISSLAEEIQRLEWNVIEIADISSVNLGDDSRIIKKRDSMIREILGAELGEPGREVFQKLIKAMENPAAELRINHLNTAFEKALFQRVERMTSISEPITINDLPESMRNEMVSGDGLSFLITIYPTNVINSVEGMFNFDEKMLGIDRRITGTISLSLVLSKEILNETGKASLAVLAVIVIFLFITFKSLSKTLLAMASLTIGVIWMMGIYSLLGQMNLVNILAVPLIIGIAIDYNVHLIHSMNREDSVEEVMRTTGKSILLSALTTMIGFGSLALLGTFRGIATLGILLFLGTLTALISSLTIIPVILLRKKTYVQEELHEL